MSERNARQIVINNDNDNNINQPKNNLTENARKRKSNMLVEQQNKQIKNNYKLFEYNLLL